MLKILCEYHVFSGNLCKNVHLCRRCSILLEDLKFKSVSGPKWQIQPLSDLGLHVRWFFLRRFLILHADLPIQCSSFVNYIRKWEDFKARISAIS